MNQIELSCQCGQVKGLAQKINPKAGTRVICYCDDCQAFARHLHRDQDVLDEWGGTDIYQVAPSQVQITQGQEHLACLRLTPKGLLRWYTSCCQTPIGNTVSGKVPFIGLIHAFIPPSEAREKALGPVKAAVHKRFATGRIPEDKIPPMSQFRYTVKILMKILIWKLMRKGQPSPLFDLEGHPCCKPLIVENSGGSK